ncbi:hypothetical protein MMPV_003549 [Pyropia vietnamensis]
MAVGVAVVTTSAGATRSRPRRRPTIRLEGGCKGVAKFNLISLGDVRLSQTEVLGAVVAEGDVSLSAFSVNSAGSTDPVCDESGASLPGAPFALVAKKLTADTGAINNGRTVVEEEYLEGSGTLVACEPEEANVDMSAIEEYVRQETATNCAAQVAGCKTVTADGGLLQFLIQSPSNGAPAICDVSADILTGASRVEVAGRGDPSDMVKIAVHGSRDDFGLLSDDRNRGRGRGANVTLTNMGFDGFVPTSTLFSMCDVPTLTVQDVGLPAAVFAPDTSFRGSSGHVNGTVAVADVEGGVEFQLAPIDCPRGRRRRRERN